MNQTLSQKRAEAVMNYFVEKGIEKDRLSAAGYGFSQPVASNDTPEGRAQNRRVQLKPMY
jgi:outer membrane protein OmpA-like peptidoglycan-associated protein